MLPALDQYEQFIYSLPDTYPVIRHSTLVVIRHGPAFAEITGQNHKHVPPDIKHHRIPAPGISFEQPNLPFLIEELQRNLLSPSVE